MNLYQQAKQRREKLLEKMSPQESLILFSAQEKRRNEDNFFPFRQDSHFYYLTSFAEPHFAALLLTPGHSEQSILFIEPGNEKTELWDGKRCILPELKERLQLDGVYAWQDWNVQTKKILKGISKIYVPPFQIAKRDTKTHPFCQVETHPVFEDLINGFSSLPEWGEVGSLVDEMRLVKSREEIQLLRKAADISGKAHFAVMSSCGVGKKEQELYGTFLETLFREGGHGEAFLAIVATGLNACTLHYRGKESVTQKGQLLLLDAGAEYQLYAGDISRTFPVAGRFQGLQKEVYGGLLDLQKKLISLVVKGNNLQSLHEACVLGIVDLLLEWKVLKGSRDKILEQKDYLPYFPHKVGHWLGLDVHDVGSFEVHGGP